MTKSQIFYQRVAGLVRVQIPGLRGEASALAQSLAAQPDDTASMEQLAALGEVEEALRRAGDCIFAKAFPDLVGVGRDSGPD